MRTTLFAFLFFAALFAARADVLKPTDFEPLTALPWKAPNATLESTLQAIFREPDPNIRYPVLAQYLRTLPAADLGKAFDQSIVLEDSQTPDDLVSLFLGIWAWRDPQGCWKRTQELFKIVGIEEADWRAYSNWNEKIIVQDPNALKTSRFHLKASSLKSFPIGVDQSWLPKKDRLQILKQFADKWFAAFGTWPGSVEFPGRYPADQPGLINAFAMPVTQCPLFGVAPNAPAGSRAVIKRGEKAAFEIAERRWLESNPAAAVDIFQKMRDAEYQDPDDRQDYYAPQTGLFLLWARLNPNGMFQWADSLDLKKESDSSPAIAAKALLLTRVAPAIRDRWLAAAKAVDIDTESWLIAEWTAWDPEKGFPVAVETNKNNIRTGAIDSTNFDCINDAAQRATCGRFRTANCRRFACETITATDIGALPAQAKNFFLEQWSVILDVWFEVDVSATAEYGVRFLSVADPDSREKWLKYYAGEHMDPVDEIIRRTVAALRIWAVTNPDTMKQWIAGLNDPDLQKSLTWLLAHPWGGEPPAKDKPPEKKPAEKPKKSK